MADNTKCTDGDACTGNDVCTAGTCKAGASIVCNDNKECTLDSCDKAVGCVYKAKPGSGVPTCDGKDIGGSCVKFTKAAVGGITWVNAQAACQTWGGNLVKIGDQTKSDAVLAYQKSLNGGVFASYWIGLNDVTTEGKYLWADGTATTYFNWDAGQPDNAGGLEDYVHVWSAAGKWNDLPPTGYNQPWYACERGMPVTCNDASVCTTGEYCDANGACGSGASVTCNDNNACTKDSCDAGKGCVYTPAPTTEDKCTVTKSPKSTASCDPCVQSICKADPFCCSNAWDAKCVQEVTTICKIGNCSGNAGSAGTCAHGLCTTGTKLTSGCDKTPSGADCVKAICAVDSFCCNSSWDGECVGEVASVCKLTCQ